MDFLVILASLFILSAFTRPITILLHELGHALPAMYLTKQDSTIFVGSYGDEKFCIKVQLFKLEIFIRYNPIKWGGGMCKVHGDNFFALHTFIYVLCGPLISLAIAIIFFYLTFYFDLHGFIKLLCVFFLGSAIIDFIGNLLPREIDLENSGKVYSDGYVLKEIIRVKKFVDKYNRAVDLFHEGNYIKAATIFHKFILQGFLSEDLYRFGVVSHMLINDFRTANVLRNNFLEKYSPNVEDKENFDLIDLYIKSPTSNFDTKLIRIPYTNSKKSPTGASL